MRILLVLALVVLARGVPIHKKELFQWDEWAQDLQTKTEPDTPIEHTRTNVCDDTTRDGIPIKVCCDGYTGTVETGCQTPICETPCENGGTCSAPNHCICTKPFSGSTCSDLKKEYRWSSWDSLNTNNIVGDSEILFNFRERVDMCKNIVPLAIECRPVQTTTSWTDQVVTCDRRLGLQCRNDEQPNGETCLDYEIRILCPVSDEASKGLRTCIHRSREYNMDEVVKGGDCSECVCQGTGRWQCHENTMLCDTPYSTTPAPRFPWLPKGAQEGQCIVGETIFNHGETTTLDCKICTCDSTTGWNCVPSVDSQCVAPSSDDHCRIDDHFIFFHGQTAKKDCNTCICNHGRWNCTQTICPDKTRRVAHYMRCSDPRSGEHHNDGEIISRECNICVCTQGKWDCTNDSCDASMTTDLPLKRVCTAPTTGIPYPHGAAISLDCNACKCFNGTWSCTRRYCSPELYPNSTCVDELTASLVKSGQTIRRDCNVCLCNSGNLTCTSIPCTTKTGVCFDEQRRFTTSSTTFSRQYRPLCKQDGTFQSIQCNPLHGVCFCVTSLGHVIPGTTVKQGTGTPNCEPYTIHNPQSFITSQVPTTEIFPCIESNTDTTTKLTGYNVPRCLPNGDFAPLQCDSHIGVCYCVTRQGTTIPDTMHHVNKYRLNCQMLREDTTTNTEWKSACQKDQIKADQYKLPFRPVCEADGHYQTLQVNTLTNVRFCVDQNGVVMEETITNGTNLNCEEFYHYVHQELKPYVNDYHLNTYSVKDLIYVTPRCLLQQQASQRIPSLYYPSCELDGRYTPKQCPDDTGVCFCVDVTGTTVAETTTPSEFQSPDCEQYRSITGVVTMRNTTSIKVFPQHSYVHSGWDSAMTTETAAIVGKQYISSTQTTVIKTNVTACIRQQQIATVVLGVFYPSCQRNGSFNTMQHQPLTNEVYCVDKNGVQIEETRTTVDVTSWLLPHCTPYWNTTVNMTRVTTHWSATPQTTTTTKPIPLDELFPAGLHHHPNCTRQQEIASRIEGAFLPTCEPNGTYTPLQCNATTGICFCMLPYGDVLPDTVMVAVTGTPNCWHLRNTSLLQVTSPVPQVCRLPPVTGPCEGRFIRWTFNTFINKCTKFVYSGCRGNENKFETKEECESTCGFLTPRADPQSVSCFQKLEQHNQMEFFERLGHRRPNCTSEGFFQPYQCHVKRTQEDRIVRVCDCVDTMTGRSLGSCDGVGTITGVILMPPITLPEIEGCLSKGVEYHTDDDFYVDCNTCKCLGQNKSTCTKNACVPGICYHLGVRSDRYKQGCEDCDCTGGRWSCRMRPDCDHEHQDMTEMGTETECPLDDDRTMRVGSYYYEDCNKCTCTSTGNVKCETKICVPGHCYHEGDAYHDHDVVNQDCNKCTCLGSKWVCQENVCDPIIRTMIRMEGCEYKQERYLNGETFFDKCKLCMCLGNNATSCSNSPCNHESCYKNGMEIVDGEKITAECNTCTCYRGVMDCTQNECLTAVSEPEQMPEVLDPSIQCTYEQKTYTHGQEFWKDCNKCRCEENTQVICEEDVCTPDLCYKDGVGYEESKGFLNETNKCTCYRGGFWGCGPKPPGSGPPDTIGCTGTDQSSIICKTNPCDSVVCPTYPDAICVPDYCGHCKTQFFDTHGNRLVC